MNWEAVGAIGETIGAIAVVVTLVFLVVQLRHSTRATEESNRLERAFAIDRHSDSIGRWRGRIVENEDLARIWLVATKDGELDDLERLRLNNLWIEFINTQRSNFVRAQTVGEAGLARQAVLSVAAQVRESKTFRYIWDAGLPWYRLSGAEFITAVEASIEQLERDADVSYRAFPFDLAPRTAPE